MDVAFNEKQFFIKTYMTELQIQTIEEEEEILCEIIENEYEMWKYGDRDTYDKVLGQKRVDNQKEYIKRLKNELYNY